MRPNERFFVTVALLFAVLVLCSAANAEAKDRKIPKAPKASMIPTVIPDPLPVQAIPSADLSQTTIQRTPLPEGVIPASTDVMMPINQKVRIPVQQGKPLAQVTTELRAVQPVKPYKPIPQIKVYAPVRSLARDVKKYNYSQPGNKK